MVLRGDFVDSQLLHPSLHLVIGNLRIGNRFDPQLLHHGLGHLLVGAGPDIDHLVVTLAVGDQP